MRILSPDVCHVLGRHNFLRAVPGFEVELSEELSRHLEPAVMQRPFIMLTEYSHSGLVLGVVALHHGVRFHFLITTAQLFCDIFDVRHFRHIIIGQEKVEESM